MCQMVNYTTEDYEHSGDEEEHSGYEASEESEELEIIRAKWLYDDCASLDEIIERLKQEIEHIKQLQRDGWELVDPVSDDYGYMRQNKNSQNTISEDT